MWKCAGFALLYLLGRSFGQEFRRDASLSSLAALMNAHGARILEGSSMFVPEKHGGEFLKMLGMWFMAEPAVSFKPGTDHRRVVGPLDCSDAEYATVLTGKRLEQDRFLVDFVAFGYDLDALEIRLVETGDAVDLFVVYESPRTQSGWPKPMVFREAMHHPRFRPFLPKILYLSASDSDIAGFTHKTLEAMHHQGKIPAHQRVGSWALEKAQRTEIIRLFSEYVKHNATLQALVHGHGREGQTWAIQNDEDELISGDALRHMDGCELRSEVKAIYTPCMSFKKSFYWLQTTSDLMCLGESSPKEEALAHFLWRPGPWLWPLSEMLKRKSTLRGVFPSKGEECRHHLGVPSAMHLSSVDDPGAAWFKRFGVIEETTHNVLSEAFVNSWGQGKVTPELIAATVHPWCSKDHPAIHLSTLPEEARQALFDSIPAVVVANPGRYPFHLPANLTQSGDTSFVRKFADPHWAQLCSQLR
jgi:hypothetical protein